MFNNNANNAAKVVNRSSIRKHLFSLLSLILVLVVFAAAGCSAKMSRDAVAPMAGRGETEDMVFTAETPAFYEEELGYQTLKSISKNDDGNAPGGGSGPLEAAQYKIRRAHLTLIIADIEKAAAEIRQKAGLFLGYVSSLEFYDLTQERRAGHISLRVPGEKFEAALEMLGEIGRVKNSNFSEEDVTLQYIDLEARIKTMETQEERLRELLGRAEKVEEVLEVEKELWRVRGNLESMIAEFRHLQQRVSYSTIDIYLEEKDPLTTSLVENLGTGEKIGNLFALNTNRLIKGSANFVVFIIGSLPILIPLAVLFFILRAVVIAVRGRKKINSRDQQGSTGTKI